MVGLKLTTSCPRPNGYLNVTKYHSFTLSLASKFIAELGSHRTHHPPSLIKMGALLSLPLLAVPSVGTVSIDLKQGHTDFDS